MYEQHEPEEAHIHQNGGMHGGISPNLPRNAGSTNASEIPERARGLTDRVLRFLSTASNETLGACLVGLTAITYMILGRLGLVLIGLVAGVCIHATWEGKEHGEMGDEARKAAGKRRREQGLDIVQRILDQRPKSTKEYAKDEDGGATPQDLGRNPDYTGFAPQTKESLEGITDAIIRDYVSWWYRPILPHDQSFPSACRQTLVSFFLSISNRLSHKRPGDVFLDFLTNSSSIIIVFLSELSTALLASRGLEPQQAIHEYLEENPGCSLGNVLDGEQQKRKLQAVADDVLQTFVDAKAYACDPVRVFLREVLAGLILDTTIASCSQADFLNGWIIWALEGSEKTELVEAIDVGVTNAASSNVVENAAKSANNTAVDGEIADSGTQQNQAQAKAEHRRTVSKAEAAMEQAMLEAQRLNEMIAEEEEKRKGNSAEMPGGTVAPIQTGSTGVPNGVTDESVNPLVNNTHEMEGGAEQSNESAVEASPGFKSFDQILSSQKPTALQADTSPFPSPPLPPPQLTLHNARISIFDDSVPGEKGNVKSKPTVEYLLQIEPATTAFPGWMVARKYADFEGLHEVLRRISVISGVKKFAERHPALPGWKGNSKSGLRIDLEKYLQDALSYQRLAECEGMKRFFDKDQHLPKASPNKTNFGFPNPAALETVGKGVLDVMTSAPKGVATGGKAIVGGVTGVFGGVASIGQKKQSSKGQNATSPGLFTGPTASSSQTDGVPKASLPRPRVSEESVPINTANSSESFQLPNPSSLSPGPSSTPPRKSQDFQTSQYENLSASPDAVDPLSDTRPLATEAAPATSTTPEETNFGLPPPPSEISDDYRTSFDDGATVRSSFSTVPTTSSPSHRSKPSVAHPEHPPRPAKTKRQSSVPSALTIQETTVAVELFFATINELYTLSSAWTLRLTLLNTAKSFLLRPGNANLEAIRQLLQSTIIDANTSDSGIAAHIDKVRENALPTEEELKKWPQPLMPEESEQRREKARKLLVARGMPQALTSVMGQAASGEALGKVFDCLQIPAVARGLLFAITLQAVRALTQ